MSTEAYNPDILCRQAIAGLVVIMLLGLLLASCTQSPPSQTAVPATTTVPPVTTVPGSAQDIRATVHTLQQFREALQQKNEIVALLLLTPSAQQRVAAHDLQQFAQQHWWTVAITDCRSHIAADSAEVVCVWRRSPRRSEVAAALIRLNDQWKIDRIEVRDRR